MNRLEHTIPAINLRSLCHSRCVYSFSMIKIEHWIDEDGLCTGSGRGGATTVLLVGRNNISWVEGNGITNTANAEARTAEMPARMIESFIVCFVRMLEYSSVSDLLVLE